uniref:Uncharacterized protein n=1 Tax=Cacopsylla melanoneura TaxID=428564 RepID=A0A8D8QBN3_9HEMI
MGIHTHLPRYTLKPLLSEPIGNLAPRIYLSISSIRGLVGNISPFVSVSCPCLHFLIIIAASEFHYLIDVYHPGSSSSLCSLSLSFDDIDHILIVPKEMSHPFVPPLL